MASLAAVDSSSLPDPRSTLAQEDTDNRSARRGKSRKRKSGDPVTSENATNGKKRTFDDFFNFCSFVLAYEEQLERQSVGKVEAGHMQDNHLNSTNNHTHLTSTDTADHSNTTPTTHSDHGHRRDTSPNPPAPHSNHHTTTTTSTAGSSTASMSESSESGDEEGERGGSVGTSKDSSNDERLEYTSEDESWNLVTCFCRRPFAGRPMIECSKCSTWVHLFCAKIRKSAVPDVYTCPKCASSSKSTSNGISSRRGGAMTSRK